MKLSVIVPVFNGEQYIENIVESFKAQKNKECFEVVFVDDGSKDKSFEKLNNLNNCGFSVKVIHQENKGVSVARNVGVSNAAGEYISFVDVDDDINSSYIDTFLSSLKSSYEVLVFQSDRVRKEDIKKASTDVVEATSISKDTMLKKMVSNPTAYGVYNLFVKKSFLEGNNIKFAEGYKYYEDYDFLYRCFAYAEDIAYTDQILYYYILRSGSAMQKFVPDRVSCIKLLEALVPLFDEKVPSFSKEFKNFGISRIYWSMMWQASLAFSFCEAMKFGKQINMKKHAKKLLGISNKKVAISSALYLVCPSVFVLLARLTSKNRLKVIKTSLSEFDSVFDKKQKVLVFGMTKNIGGIESYVMNQYRHLDDLMQFDFIVDWDHMAFEDEVITNGSKVFHIPAKSKSPIVHLSKFFKILISHPEYKTVYFNVLNAKSAFSMIPAYLLKRRIVVHSHSALDQDIKRHKISRPILNKMADIKLACSFEAGKHLYGSSDFVVINNGIDVSKYVFSKEIRNKIRKELEISDSEFVVLHVGRMSKEKNPLFIVDIARAFEGKATLLYVGSGDMEEEILSYASGITNIKFLGTRSDTPLLYQAADAFILPSFYEGLPIVAIEAQASDLNLFVSNTVSKELEVTDKVHFLDINKPASYWAEQIMSCDTSKRRDNSELLSKAGYDVKDSIEKVIEVLK